MTQFPYEPRDITREDAEKAVSEYGATGNAREVAAKFKITRGYLYQLARVAGVKSGEPRKVSRAEAALADYVETREPLSVISKRHGVSVGTIYKIAIARGTPITKLSRYAPKRLDDARREQIVADWQAGMSGPDMAAKYGVHPSYPRVLAQRAGLTAKVREPARYVERAYRVGPKLPGQEPATKPTFLARHVDVAEARRLSQRGLGLTAIAAMMRAPYKAVFEAISA